MGTAGEILVDCLIEWGVSVVFGLPGDGINGIMEALRQKQAKIRFIQARHEESAAFMACAYAKYTGKLGVCLATSGPGGIHLLNGLYDAKLDGQPVLAITGLQFHDLLHTYTQQDVELDKLFENVTVYNARVMGPAHVDNVVNLACRTALARRGVAHITIPVDFQEQSPGSNRSKRNIPNHTTSVWNCTPVVPNSLDLKLAADVLNQGKKIVILAGQGALQATDELEEIAEILGAPIVKALLGKAAVPDDSPYTTGGIGLLGTTPSTEAMERCDTLLMIGTSFPYMEFYPKPGQARCIQIEIDPVKIGLRYPVDVALIGDSRAALQQLIPLLKRNPERDFLKKAQEGMKAWNKKMAEICSNSDMPLKPQVFASEIGKRLDDDAIISADSGTNTTWMARHIPAKRGQMYSLSGNLATMAPGLPYAIAAQIAYPDRQCIAFVGDGGFSMLMADFVTAVKYQLPIKVFIVKNNSLGQIKWEQMVFLGNPEFTCDLQPINFALFAEACGGKGFTIDNPSQCGAIIEKALNTPGPVIVEAVVDSNEPPLPPKIQFEQAKNFSKSLLRGQQDGLEIVKTLLKDTYQNLFKTRS